MKRILSAFLALVMLFSLAACKKDEDPAGTYITAEEKTAIVNELGKVYMEISVKDYGKITMELYPEIAPVTVKNFVKLVSEDFYSGIIFHRVIKDFMIQGGDPDGNGSGGSPDKIYGEYSENGVENNLSHTRGVVSMARLGNDYNSASSQFFICHADSTYLDGQYAAFGKVVHGMAVVDAIANTETNSADKPTKDITIEYIKRVDSPEMAPVKAEMEIQGYEGKIEMELYPDVAPQTVANFTDLAKKGFYNGLTFHKVSKDGYVQGGDPEGTGFGGSDKEITGEFSDNGIENNLKHERGVISMARKSGYDSATSQFLVCLKEYKNLDGSYAAFGKVTSGLEILDAVSATEVGENKNPVNEIKIKYIKIGE